MFCVFVLFAKTLKWAGETNKRDDEIKGSICRRPVGANSKADEETHLMGLLSTAKDANTLVAFAFSAMCIRFFRV